MIICFRLPNDFIEYSDPLLSIEEGGNEWFCLMIHMGAIDTKIERVSFFGWVEWGGGEYRMRSGILW